MGTDTDTAENWDDFFVRTPVVPLEHQHVARDDVFAYGDAGPSTLTRTPIAPLPTPPVPPPPPTPPVVARHVAEMENWDDDFADEEECSVDGELEGDPDEREDGEHAGRSSSTSASTASVGVVSPRSVRTHAQRVGGGVGVAQNDFGEENSAEEDSDEESWGEEEDEDEQEDDELETEEIWDEEEDRARVPPVLAALATAVDASSSPSPLPLSSTSSSNPSSNPGSSLSPSPSRSSIPNPTAPKNDTPSSMSSEPLYAHLPPSELPVQSTPAFASLQPAPAPASGSSSPSVLSGTLSASTVLSTAAPAPAPKFTSTSTSPPPAPAPTSPPSPTFAEFGCKTEHEEETEDEDATITARSRRGRRVGGHMGGHTGGHTGDARGDARGHSGSARVVPVPPVPPAVPFISSIPTFTPRPTLSSSSASPSSSRPAITAPDATTPDAAPPPDRVEEDRGEGPSRHVPVFSPPVASPQVVSPPTVSPPGAAAPVMKEHRSRQQARPRTADGVGLQSHSRGQESVRGPARASLDAYRAADTTITGGHARKDAPSDARRDARRNEAGAAGLFTRLGQGVARWAGASTGPAGSCADPNANANPDVNANTAANVTPTASKNSDTATEGRGRARSATVTGALPSSLSSSSAAPAPAADRTVAARRPSVSGRPLAFGSGSAPKVASDAVPRSSLSSLARPSTSSARPSTSSSASASTSSSSAQPSSPSARPSASSARPPSSGSSSHAVPRPSPRAAAPAAQRTSIASLLSIYTHRSRASSVSVTVSGSGSGSGSRRTSVVDNVEDRMEEEAAPRASIGSWTRGLFSSSSSSGGGGGESRVRQSLDGARAVAGVGRRGSVSSQNLYSRETEREREREREKGGQRQRQSLDVRPRSRWGVVETSAGSSTTAALASGGAGAGGGTGGRETEMETETKGVLGFFGRRRRSNTVTVTTVPLSSSSSGAAKDDAEEVYANKKASRSQRSLLLLGRRPSMLVRRASQRGVGGGVGGQVVKEKERATEVEREDIRREEEKSVEAKPVAAPPAQVVFSPPPLALASRGHAAERPVPVSGPGPGPAPEAEPAAPLATRGVKRRIPSGRASLSLPLAPPTRSESEPLIGARMDMDTHQNGTVGQSHKHKHTHTQSQSSSRSTSHSTSTSLSSIGELRIPSRISQAQVSIRRDLGLVKEFAGKVAELKDLQGSYLQMIESVQGMIDSDNGQPLLLPARTLRPRSNTSPALSRPPSRSPLASLFQGPDKSLNVTASDHTSPEPLTPMTTSVPSVPLYNSTDLAQRMADITARYDSWWECAELLIELGNTPPSMLTPVSTVRLVPPTSVIEASAPPPSPAPTPQISVATVTSKSQGDTHGAPPPATSTTHVSPTSNHADSTLKPSRGRANTFAGNMPVARLRSASTSTASISHDAPNHMLSPSASSASSAPSHTWRATTGRHDLSQRQLVLLRQMLGVDQKPRPSAAATGPVTMVDDGDDDGLDGSDGESDMEDATWRWGHANTVQLPSPAEEQEAYFGIAGQKKEHNRPWSRPYHNDIAQSEYEDHGPAVYVSPAPDPSETKKSKGMNAIRDMLRTLKRAHPPTPTSSTFPMNVEAPPSLAPAPTMSVQFSQTATNLPISLAPNRHAIRKAASLLPLSATTQFARVPSTSSTVSRASKIDPTLAFAMTPDNIKPLLDNAREVRARLGACVADVQALLASAGVDSVVAG